VPVELKIQESSVLSADIRGHCKMCKRGIKSATLSATVTLDGTRQNENFI